MAEKNKMKKKMTRKKKKDSKMKMKMMKKGIKLKIMKTKNCLKMKYKMENKYRRRANLKSIIKEAKIEVNTRGDDLETECVNGRTMIKNNK